MHALTQWHTLDHVLKLAEAQLHLENGLNSYRLWLQQDYVCQFGWLRCTAMADYRPYNPVVSKLPCIIDNCHVQQPCCRLQRYITCPMVKIYYNTTSPIVIWVFCPFGTLYCSMSLIAILSLAAQLAYLVLFWLGAHSLN